MISDPLPEVRVYREGSTVHTRLLGPVNRETAPVFQQRLERLVREDCTVLTLDLGEAAYLNSDGVRWLQRLQDELLVRNVELRLLVREGSRIARTLGLLQLDRTFTIVHYPAESLEPVAVPSG